VTGVIDDISGQSISLFVNTASAKRHTAISAPTGSTRSWSLYVKAAHPQAPNEEHSIPQICTALHNHVDHNHSDADPSFPLRHWLSSNNDPFAKGVEQKPDNELASLADFSELEREMERDATRIIESHEVPFGTVF
jgi:hypothetical protein